MKLSTRLLLWAKKNDVLSSKGIRMIRHANSTVEAIQRAESTAAKAFLLGTKVFEAVSERFDIQDELVRQGWKADYVLGEDIAQQLCQVLGLKAEESIQTLVRIDGDSGFLIEYSEHEVKVYWHGELFKRWLQKKFWSEYRSWDISKPKWYGREAVHRPLGSQYEAFLSWVDKSQQRDTSSCCLLVGATGTGKTTSALSAVHGRVLVLPDDCFNGSMDFVIQSLEPDVLIIDDIELTYGSFNSSFASTLESLRPLCKVLILTFMEDDEVTLKPGVFYYPGMRAGRIDRIYHIKPPNREDREAILKSFGSNQAKALSKITKGLSGAYLKVLVEEYIENFATAQEAVDALRLCAPESMST